MEKVLTKIKQFNYKSLLNYGLLFLIFFICNSATVGQGYLKPFCFAVYYTVVFKKSKSVYTSVLFAISYLVLNFNLFAFYTGINLIFVALIFKGLHILIKKEAKNFLICLYAVLGNIANLILSFTDLKSFMLSVVSVVIGIVFLICCLTVVSVKNRNIKTTVNTDELICFSVIISVLAMGLASFNFYKIELFKIIFVCLILMFTYIFKPQVTIIFAVMFGLGVSIYYSNLSYVAALTLMAVSGIAFKSSYKIIASLSLILCEVVCGLYFVSYSVFSVYSVISVVVGELIFMFVPSRILNELNNRINGLTDNVAVRSIINRSRENLFNRMLEISNVFLEMDTVYRQMVVGVMPEPDAKQMVKAELLEKCCKDCPNKTKCFRVNGKLNADVFNDVVNMGFEKGKLTLIDVPQYLTSQCLKVNGIINNLNALLKSYKHYAVMVNNLDAAKVLIADQLKGVSGLIKALAEEVNLNIVYDLNKENRIKEELSYKNVCCLNSLVYEQNSSLKIVSLIIADPKIEQVKIEKVVSKVVGGKMQITTVKDTAIPNSKEVVLQTKPNYDIVFGSAAQTKTGKVLSGDTHSLIKIDDGKYMVALCDGMGSGENAYKVSDLTITLIENFYRAGFENEIILNSVNKLLTLNNSESFSAVDICVLDLRKNIMDFIKLGSPVGFIKRKNEVETIESCGLPIGVLDEMKPNITKRVFTDFDIIVLVSDGVTDAFGDIAELKTFINNLETVNPQVLADEILERAVDLVNGNCCDDFTVLAVRVFPVV